MEKTGQNARLSYTLSYKGIITDASNSYHPEKLDITISKTIDYIEGESLEDTQARIEKTEEATMLLQKSVEKTLAEKIQDVRDKLVR